MKFLEKKSSFTIKLYLIYLQEGMSTTGAQPNSPISGCKPHTTLETPKQKHYLKEFDLHFNLKFFISFVWFKNSNQKM